MPYSSFSYNNVRSSSYGLLISQPPAIGVPKRKETVENVPGRDGTLRIVTGGFEDLTVSYSVGFKTGLGNVEYMARAVKQWLLSGAGLCSLEDDFDKAYFRLGYYSGTANIENIFNRGGKTTLDFTCRAKKYSYVGQQLHTIYKSGKIINTELFDSLPYLKIFGTGAVELYINSTTIQISQLDGYLELDSEVEQAYKGSVSKNNTVLLTEFPRFVPEVNTIQWSGNITRIDYKPRWCTI